MASTIKDVEIPALIWAIELRNIIIISLSILHWLSIASIWADDRSPVVIEDALQHVRTTAEREWAWFPEYAPTQRFEREFESSANAEAWTLTLRQQNVKQAWDVRLNGASLGRLVRDESDMRVDFPVPPGSLIDGKNRLEIRQNGTDADDIRIGEVRLYPISAESRRNLAHVEISLVDPAGAPMPGRITITDQAGALIPVGAVSNHDTAVRQGVVYTLSGKAAFGVAPGEYRIVATRGFEYSLTEVTVQPTAGQRIAKTLVLSRQVDTRGWVACDTHVHTVTHSGHGDCTIEERMVTLAGEGIELPIATDHNKAIDYRPIAESMGADAYFTPVIGDECTTKQGHFNIFPIRPGSELPDHTQTDWKSLLADIASTPDVKVAILNHARDIHSGVRPFSPARHNRLTAERLDGQALDFNAMEIINSGAVQTETLELFHDWCGLINRGLDMTPVGCSDSHDVARFIVGQGRTYVRCDDSNPGQIDVADAIDAFVQGRVIVSYGLLVNLTVHDDTGPGDLVSLDPDQGDLVVTARVTGPAWTRADSVALYVCGRERFRHLVAPPSGNETAVDVRVTWRLPRSECRQDLWLTAVATGPGITDPAWATALPYQPTSTSFSPTVFSSTGAIRVDGDGDGTFTSSFEYAQQFVRRHAGDAAGLLNRLRSSDPSVIHHVASLLRTSGDALAELEALAQGKVATALSEARRADRMSVVAKLEGVQ
ncbi:MAG: hypothetical protein F9B45_26435 [Phycisphaera sp. RhM]|nr:hypothetical protein [Phycisphaera sp. RhM]